MGKELFQDKFLTVLVSGGFKKVCYREWGTPDSKKVLICVHGLSRNRLDFDTIAAALSSYYRILAIDMPGRGNSDWLDQPEDYRYLVSKGNQFPIFHNVLNALIARSEADRVDWIGTSMGGLLGIELASKVNSPVNKLVLNDIGPFVSAEGRAGNAALASAAGIYDTKEEGVQFVLESKKAFGPFTPEAAQKFARDSLTKTESGKWRLHYDPKIVTGREPGATSIWRSWERISSPVLTIWGKESALLTAETVSKMQITGPKTELLAIDGVGHCPGLTTDMEIDRIKSFLLEP